MSVTKKTSIEIDLRKEIFKVLSGMKLEIIGLLLFWAFWWLGFVIYSTTMYQLLMIIFSCIYVTVYFYFVVKLRMQLNVVMENMQTPEFITSLIEQHKDKIVEVLQIPTQEET